MLQMMLTAPVGLILTIEWVVSVSLLEYIFFKNKCQKNLAFSNQEFLAESLPSKV